MKVSSLACKCEDTMELNIEGLQKQKWNLPTDEAQSADEKNGVIFLVIMFTPGVMIIEMLKMAYCLYFLLIIAKEISHDLRKIFQRIWKILFTSLKNCYWIIDFWATFINPWKYRISVFLLTKQFLYTISHER